MLHEKMQNRSFGDMLFKWEAEADVWTWMTQVLRRPSTAHLHTVEWQTCRRGACYSEKWTITTSVSDILFLKAVLPFVGFPCTGAYVQPCSHAWSGSSRICAVSIIASILYFLAAVNLLRKEKRLQQSTTLRYADSNTRGGCVKKCCNMSQVLAKLLVATFTITQASSLLEDHFDHLEVEQTAVRQADK